MMPLLFLVLLTSLSGCAVQYRLPVQLIDAETELGIANAEIIQYGPELRLRDFFVMPSGGAHHVIYSSTRTDKSGYACITVAGRNKALWASPDGYLAMKIHRYHYPDDAEVPAPYAAYVEYEPGQTGSGGSAAKFVEDGFLRVPLHRRPPNYEGPNDPAKTLPVYEIDEDRRQRQ